MAQEGLQLGEHDHGFDSEAFSRSFPLPLRILSLITLGLLGWATNLHFLTRLGIDTTSVLDVRVSEHAYAPLNSNAAASNSLPARHLHPSRLFPPVYKLAAVLALWTFFGLAVYTLAGSHPGEGPLDNIVPIAFASIALLSIFLPVDKLYKQERFMFLRSLRRTMFEGIHSTVPFCDVILADVLTSFAKVLGDVWISISLLFDKNARHSWSGRFGVPMFTALPYLLRFRQCIADFNTTPIQNTSALYRSNSNTPSDPRNRALCNALKYATAFPVIIFSAMQGRHDLFDEDEADVNAIASGWFSPSSVFRFWIVSVFVNSLYSFWWDVTNDWGLALLAPSAHSSTSNFKRSAASVGSQSRYQVGVSLLRTSTLLSDPWIYYAAIAIDLLLRLTWSFKLSLHLHAIHEIEQGIYLMEALEVLRRWMWTFIRIEWETIKKVESHHPSRSSTHSHASQENTMVLSDRAHTTAHKDPSGLGISGIEYTHDSAV